MQLHVTLDRDTLFQMYKALSFDDAESQDPRARVLEWFQRWTCWRMSEVQRQDISSDLGRGRGRRAGVGERGSQVTETQVGGGMGCRLPGVRVALALRVLKTPVASATKC